MEVLETGDEIGKSVIYQYLSAIVSVLSGFLFYIYIVRVFTTEVVGVVALLSAMMILFSTIFGFGLSFGVQHFISYYIGKNDPESLRSVVKEISIVLILVSILAIVFMLFSSPAFAYLFCHTYRYLDIIRIMGFAVVANLGASVTGGDGPRTPEIQGECTDQHCVYSSYVFRHSNSTAVQGQPTCGGRRMDGRLFPRCLVIFHSCDRTIEISLTTALNDSGSFFPM